MDFKEGNDIIQFMFLQIYSVFSIENGSIRGGRSRDGERIQKIIEEFWVRKDKDLYQKSSIVDGKEGTVMKDVEVL